MNVGDERAESARRPPFGAPCNGCGYCCTTSPCAIARYHIGCGETGPCPALVADGGIHRCGMILAPSRFMRLPPGSSVEAAFGELFARELGVGRGCCASDEAD